MGNFLTKLSTAFGEWVVIWELCGILDHATDNKVNDVAKYKSKSHVNPADVCRLETIMDMVRAQSSTTKWDEIVQLMVSTLYEKPVLDGFCEVVVHTTNYFNEMKLHHMLTLYTLFVDVISCNVQK